MSFNLRCSPRPSPQVKMTAARSLGDIAVDLTENGAAKTTKLNVGTKHQLIMASNGSLVSTGDFTVYRFIPTELL